MQHNNQPCRPHSEGAAQSSSAYVTVPFSDARSWKGEEFRVAKTMALNREYVRGAGQRTAPYVAIGMWPALRKVPLGYGYCLENKNLGEPARRRRRAYL
jgi:hypothetical protein